MVKLVFLCHRRPDITHEQYAEHLLRRHVPLALRHHPTLRRYTVNIVDHSPAGEEGLDSIGELSFDRFEDYRDRLYDSAEGERIVHEDVAGFLGGAHAYAASEHVQKPGTARSVGARTPGFKMFCPLRRRPELTHEQFVAHWLGVHVPLALEHHPTLVRYVTNVVDQRLSHSAADWDGFAELSFASPDDARQRMFASPEAERIVRADIARFIGHTFAYPVAEYPQL
ncbi:MAG: EthD family reductase [Candidatus Binatia bacterium]